MHIIKFLTNTGLSLKWNKLRHSLRQFLKMMLFVPILEWFYLIISLLLIHFAWSIWQTLLLIQWNGQMFFTVSNSLGYNSAPCESFWTLYKSSIFSSIYTGEVLVYFRNVFRNAFKIWWKNDHPPWLHFVSHPLPEFRRATAGWKRMGWVHITEDSRFTKQFSVSISL